MNTHLLGFPPGTEQHERNEEMLLRYFTALTASPVCAASDAFGMALRSETPECGLGMNDEDALRDLWTMACQSPSMTGVGQSAQPSRRPPTRLNLSGGVSPRSTDRSARVLPSSESARGRGPTSHRHPRDSSEGEPLNVCGPGTFEPAHADYFSHPNAADIDLSEVIPRTVNGMSLGVESLSEAAEVTLGLERVRMAQCFSALNPEMLSHMVWFNYQSGANIHPQYADVLTSFGQVRGGDGRGSSSPGGHRSGDRSARRDHHGRPARAGQRCLRLQRGVARQLLAHQAQDTGGERGTRDGRPRQLCRDVRRLHRRSLPRSPRDGHRTAAAVLRPARGLTD